ncbi:MAG: replication-associated recombination protein A [Deltaproteobacteria bacterium]|nr:replication-associated recombination protein A [Deltaproteobacteria bacterium]
MDLFEQDEKEVFKTGPLADRVRPNDLEKFLGQDKIVGPGTPLRRMIENDTLPSLILWGPPGTGKTTLARIIAGKTRAKFVPFSAVLGGVKEIREIVKAAQLQKRTQARSTILFVDEIHRFNKAQQDAFLPHVENGTIILIGATTENPSFEITSALLSRCKVIVLEPLSEENIIAILKRAIEDPEKGLGKTGVKLEPGVFELIAEKSHGDARNALNALEALVCSFEDTGKTVKIDRKTAQASFIKSSLLYDRSGEEHYNVISAFIKSMRGSDPDAAVYWMVRMLESGEDPLFILRRMVIFASEDVGNADPNALAVAVHALESFKFVGLPEGVLPMTQAATYLACAEKSNSVIKAYTAARKDVMELGALAVPKKLRNAPTVLMKSLGYAKDYKYPHDFKGAYVPEAYLPEQLESRRYYEPSPRGVEAEIRERLNRWFKQRKKGE